MAHASHPGHRARRPTALVYSLLLALAVAAAPRASAAQPAEGSAVPSAAATPEGSDPTPDGSGATPGGTPDGSGATPEGSGAADGATPDGSGATPEGSGAATDGTPDGSGAAADGTPEGSGERSADDLRPFVRELVIGPGHEAEIEALVTESAGSGAAAPVGSGYVFDAISVSGGTIRFGLTGPGGTAAGAVVATPRDDSAAVRSRSFSLAIEPGASPEAQALLEQAVARIIERDQGGFYHETEPTDSSGMSPSAPAAQWVRGLILIASIAAAALGVWWAFFAPARRKPDTAPTPPGDPPPPADV
ncbi:MAG: hypothetical protein H6697_04500 [Myxococcales bacterium]|nr:hypothetical protein [Myxococcales bacterium]MCB9520224.1 hypothetical protein [Myxococcales bacterium]